jgi:hypothetical protein
MSAPVVVRASSAFLAFGGMMLNETQGILVGIVRETQGIYVEVSLHCPSRVA